MRAIGKIVLFPVSLIYGLVVIIRNKLFDFKIIKTTEFRFPVISVGNITVGGTGKTPHTEYLIRLLKDQYKVAFLSRGYMRKTRDFIVATEQSTAAVIGDEPLQIKRKFPDLTVAVDKKRVNGINKLLENIPGLDIVLLDDAYQHRYVTPGINILIIDYNKPLKGDWLLPYGRLRESASEKKRADIIIVSKTPKKITAMDKRMFEHNIRAQSHQRVYFTTIAYGKPLPVFIAGTQAEVTANTTVLLVTGIAEPSLLLGELSSQYKDVVHFRFPDHYSFTKDDLAKIVTRYNEIEGSKVIFTTEKDAARLISFDHDETILPEAWFYIPITMEFMGNDEEQFTHQIIHYVKNNSRNSILYKK